MAKHALLSASGAHRWLLCTPSAQLEQKFPASTSAYAEEGTVAHALAELTTRYFLGELDEVSYPIWTQPIGTHDAYNTGDIVQYKDKLYRSLIDGNVWSPEAYPQGWEEYTPTK